MKKRHKLDDKSVKCVFVGYSDETKGYRLYNPKNKDLIINCDVIFNENDTWNWKIEGKDSPLIVEEEEMSSFDSSTIIQGHHHPFPPALHTPNTIHSMKQVNMHNIKINHQFII